MNRDRRLPRVAWYSAASQTMLTALVVACQGGSSTPAAPEGDMLREGMRLHHQDLHTWPSHDRLELEHQLIVRSEDVETTMQLMDIQPGWTVGDIGCGSGFYTFRMADAAGPEGKVWAIDIQQGSIDFLEERLREPAYASYTNIEVRLTQVDDTTLPANVLDAALLSHADFYAYATMLPENDRMLADLYEVMKPGGNLAVLQNLDIVQGSKVDVIIDNFVEAGFTLDLSIDLPTDNDAYLRFKKPAAPIAPNHEVR